MHICSFPLDIVSVLSEFFLGCGGGAMSPRAMEICFSRFGVLSMQEKKALVMTRRCVYSRAYHKELTKTGQHELARALGNQAVEEWLAQQDKA